MAAGKSIVVKETAISIIEVNKQDYISLTDMIKSFGDESIIYNWPQLAQVFGASVPFPNH